MCSFSTSNKKKLATGLVGTRWLNAVVRLRSTIYEEYRCDDTDNVAPKDIGLETSNKCEEFNDATVYRNATKSL